MDWFWNVLEDEEHDGESKSEKRNRILGGGVVIAIYLHGEDQWGTRSYYFNLDWKKISE